MNDEDPPPDEAAPRPRRLAKLALRAIDACLGALQRLRNRFAAEEAEAERDGGRRSRSAEGEPPAEPARPQTPLRRMLILLMCLLIGGVAGTLFSYRLFSKALDSRGTTIEFMQETIDQARKDEVRNLKTQAKCREENGEYWKQMHESQRETEDCQVRVEELEKQVAALQAVERPAPQAGRGAMPTATSPATPRPRAPLKTGNCVTGATNLADNLAGCLEKFNRP